MNDDDLRDALQHTPPLQTTPEFTAALEQQLRTTSTANVLEPSGVGTLNGATANATQLIDTHQVPMIEMTARNIGISRTKRRQFWTAAIASAACVALIVGVVANRNQNETAPAAGNPSGRGTVRFLAITTYGGKATNRLQGTLDFSHHIIRFAKRPDAIYAATVTETVVWNGALYSLVNTETVVVGGPIRNGDPKIASVTARSSQMQWVRIPLPNIEKRFRLAVGYEAQSPAIAVSELRRDETRAEHLDNRDHNGSEASHFRLRFPVPASATLNATGSTPIVVESMEYWLNRSGQVLEIDAQGPRNFRSSIVFSDYGKPNFLRPPAGYPIVERGPGTDNPHSTGTSVPAGATVTTSARKP